MKLRSGITDGSGGFETVCIVMVDESIFGSYIECLVGRIGDSLSVYVRTACLGTNCIA